MFYRQLYCLVTTLILYALYLNYNTFRLKNYIQNIKLDIQHSTERTKERLPFSTSGWGPKAAAVVLRAMKTT